jgi:arylformamidase
MTVVLPEGWFDISMPLKQGMVYYPTEPAPRIYRIQDINLGSKVNVSMLEFSAHTGTHIDAPLHFLPGGSTISDMPMEVLLGPCRVIEIIDTQKISQAELIPCNLKKGQRVLFKTRNSPLTYTSPKFVEDYVYLDSDTAVYLAGKGVILVGLDDLSIGNYKDQNNQNIVHRTLLEAGICILEGLVLDQVPPGEYDLICLPLLMYNGEAAPCRAILRPMK